MLAVAALGGIAVAPASAQPVLPNPVTASGRAVVGETPPGAEPAVPAQVAPVNAAPLRFGVATPGGPVAGEELDAVAELTGENPALILSYQDFVQPPPIAELEAVAARGATTLLTWEPWVWGGGVEQPAYRSAVVASGTYDDHIAWWGRELAAWGKPVLLRYGHEMNGDWYPWADRVNGNSPGDYVAAWRHVHDVLTAAGATNVTWVWSPNVPDAASQPLIEAYPGERYVDAVALDGYNWGTTQPWSAWLSPSELFGQGLALLRMLAPGKEILVAETASAEQGGSKAAWNADLVDYLVRQPAVTAVVWFDLNKEVDWRIDSSPESARSLASALRDRRVMPTSP
jgi:beta-mannanase